MKKQVISCPKCSHKFEIGKLLESEIEERIKKKLESDQDAWREKEKARLERKVKEELKDSVGVQMEDLHQSLAEKDAALKKAQKSELEIRKSMRELAEKAEAFEVEKQRILDAERKKIQDTADVKAEEKLRNKLQEKDIQLRALADKIDELQKKSEKTSQELQGSAQEISLLEILQKAFTEDSFERVGKGKRGGDIVQSVKTTGVKCGTIVWESKNAAGWSNAWVEKLRSDRNAEKADVAILVSTVLPAGMNGPGCIDGIWVCDLRTAPVIASAIRSGLIELARVRSTLESRADMKDIVVRYLMSNEFKQRIERVLRTFMTMKTQIEKERAQTLKWLGERDAQLNIIAEDVNGFRGELEGILQTQLPGPDRLAIAAS